MSRIGKEEYFMQLAYVAAKRSTCARRQVGCVLTDVDGKVLAIGYNGSPSGWPHCIDTPCPGAKYKSGEGLDFCEAIHAEQNAVSQCKDLSEVFACHVTTSPCMNCAKLLVTLPNLKFVGYDELYQPQRPAITYLAENGIQCNRFVEKV